MCISCLNVDTRGFSLSSVRLRFAACIYSTAQMVPPGKGVPGRGSDIVPGAPLCFLAQEPSGSAITPRSPGSCGRKIPTNQDLGSQKCLCTGHDIEISSGLHLLTTHPASHAHPSPWLAQGPLHPPDSGHLALFCINRFIYFRSFRDCCILPLLFLKD